MIRRLAAAAAIGAVVLAIACGCSSPDRRAEAESDPGRSPGAGERPEPPTGPSPASVVLVSIDTLRSDRLPAYGYDGVSTPAIDGLREDGILFRRAYSPVPLTTPAHATILSGLLPPDHGVRDNSGFRYEPGPGEALADRLRRAGYTTGAVVSSFTIRRATGLDAGFDHFDDELPPASMATIGEIQRRGDATLERALTWLRDAPEPFFLFLHLYDPHTPWEPPEPFASRYGETYEGEIAFADSVVGELLDELEETGRYHDAAVVLLSDHGEGLGDHGEDEHGILLYRESLQVPLVIKLPGGARAGETVDRPVHLVDVAPTVLELAGLDVPDDLPGRSLLSPPVETTPRLLYAETFYPRLRFGWSELTSIVRGRYHYIHGPAPELYDLESDPEERRNVIREERSTYIELRRELEGIDHALEEMPSAVDPETREALAALGYVGGSPGARSEGPLPDPKSRLHTLEPVKDGVTALRRGDLEEAVELFLAALELDDGLFDAWQFLGVAYHRQGRLREAYDAYREAYRLSGGAPSLAAPLAQVSIALGRKDEAVPLLRTAIEQQPEHDELHFYLTRALIETGRIPEALEAAEETLRLLPESPDAHYQIGVVKLALDRHDEARRHLARALEIAPDHAAALSDLAVLHLMEGRPEEARPLLERVLELQPGNPQATELLRRIDEARGTEGSGGGL